MKVDTKSILALHDAVITHNPRVLLSGDYVTTFNLHITQIKEEDSGQYMCQINTDPMTKQVLINACALISLNLSLFQAATLSVMVPPDITHSTADLILQQGQSANLECHADGTPMPKISWRREDNSIIKVKNPKGKGGFKKGEYTERKMVRQTFKFLLLRIVRRYFGTSLTVPRVTPDDMGSYLCIASNNVSPAQSKRILVNVQCKHSN